VSERSDQIDRFLADTGWPSTHRQHLAGDASGRRYQRLHRSGHPSLILMDAPPADTQSFASFLSIARHLRQLGLSAPDILASNKSLGLILMEDLGHTVFARQIDAHPADELTLYQNATDVVIALRDAALPSGIQHHTASELAGFTQLATEWYCRPSDDQNLALLAELETVLVPVAEDQATLALRDYHAENLIWIADRIGVARVGLLDFQDAVIAHASYDLASLLTDARRDVPDGLRDAMISRYVAATGIDADQFHADFAVVSVQRNLRILGIFARLARAHGKPSYIDLIPRVWRYLMLELNHPALSRLRECAIQAIPEPTPQYLKELLATCATRPGP